MKKIFTEKIMGSIEKKKKKTQLEGKLEKSRMKNRIKSYENKYSE